MHRYSRLVEELVELVSIELFVPAGVLSGGRLLVTAFREGARNVYLFDGYQLMKLNRDPIYMVAEPPHEGSRVVVGRDVAAGRELIKFYVLNPESPGVEEELHPDQKPARVFGLADDGTTIAFTAVHEKGIGAYVVRNGSLRKVADIPGIAALSRVRRSLGVGVGVFPPDMRFFKLFTLDLDSGEVRIHEAPERGNVVALDIGPDGSVIYGLEGAKRARLYKLDPSEGKSEPLEESSALASFGATSFNQVTYLHSGELVVIARKKGRSSVFLEGSPLEAPEGMHYGAREWRGRIIVAHSSIKTPHRIVALDKSGNGWDVVLEGAKPWWLAEAMGNKGYTEATSSDGECVPTLYLESKRSPRPGPTVVLVHGGPFSEDTDTWDVFAAALAAAGFHVVQPNYRGSVGYGVEWTEKLIGDPCGMELEDVIAAARWARDSGLASRLYVMGYSYGGFMTLCALTRKPGVFDAGVAGASVTDWELMYELSDPAFKSFIEMIFAGRKDLWKERSPITHVEKLKEPVILVHPQNDTRTPLKPVLRFIEKASDLGKKIEAYIAPDMGHAVNRVEDVVKILLPAIMFLARQEEAKTE